jgi:DNA-directed RNA polymerase subunit N (RpoN/RPB10)
MIRMGRRKTIRLIESIHSKGIFGPCSCGGEVLYYTDKGVRCSTCGKLYGVWAEKRYSLIQRAQELLFQSQQPNEKETLDDLEISEQSKSSYIGKSTDEDHQKNEMIEESVYS